jgi:hypothetical protein
MYHGGRSKSPLCRLFLEKSVIKRHTPAADIRTIQPITAPCHGIACVPIDGMDDLPLDVFHDSHMVGVTVLLPVEKDDVAGTGI